MRNEPASTVPDERWEALARWMSGEADAKETAALEAWLAGAPGRRERAAALRGLIGPLGPSTAEGLDTGVALARLHGRMNAADVHPLAPHRTERRAWSRRMMVLRAAAAVLVVLLGGLLWRGLGLGGTDGGPAAGVWATETGRTAAVTLPDGTEVLLGPDSRLALGDGYGTTAREVELNGEALFDVRDAEGSPFTVRAGAGVIVDLGTSFSVNSVDPAELRVVVTSGAVRLQAARGALPSGVVLRAGDRGVLRADGMAIAEPAAATDVDLAWTNGRLVFEDAPIERVRLELRRWYGIELRVDDPALGGRRLTATFENETVDQILDVIALVLGAGIERAGDTAILRGPTTR